MPGIDKLEFGLMTVLPDRTLCPGAQPGCASNYVGALNAPVSGSALFQQDEKKQEVLEETVEAIQAAWQNGIDAIKAIDATTTLCVAFTDDGPTIVVEDAS